MNQEIPGRIGILRPLRLRDFALLWTGMAISMVGDGVYVVAIAWQVYEISNRPSALALVGVAWSLPQVLLMLLSGALADRFNRRRLMIAGDLIRCGAIATIGTLSITGRLTIPLVIGLVAVYGVGQAIFQPSFSAIVPTIVPGELLVEANSLAQFVRPFSMMLLGPLMGGLLIAAFGAGWAFVFDGGTFVFSALMILLMRTRPEPRDADSGERLMSEVVEGLRYVIAHRWLILAMVGATVSLLATWGPWETLVPYVIKNELHGGPTALGLVFGAGGLGSVAAALFFGQRGTLPRRPVTALYLAWAIAMFGTAGFGLVTGVWQAMIVALATEACITILVVIWYTLVQRLVPNDLLGRVTSLDWMISIAGVPLSFAIVGPVASAIGARMTLVLGGILGGGITLAVMFLPGARDPERDGSLDVPAATS
ncbi:MFS transporter [bacterium]|jgi:MFS family permease|nr:MAG: MFS transporter [bacterium]